MPPQEVINKCAAIAAYYSKSKYSSNVPVDYTLKKKRKKKCLKQSLAWLFILIIKLLM